MNGFRPINRKHHRSIAAAAIGAGALTLGTLAASATAAGAAQVSNPGPTPIKPCAVQNFCWSTHSRTVVHHKYEDLWAVADFPANTQHDVWFELTCDDGTHTTGTTTAYPDVPNFFGALGANNGIMVAHAQPGNNASTTCTLKESVKGSWTITSFPGALSGGTEYVRFENV